jgi:hypothetical protein
MGLKEELLKKILDLKLKKASESTMKQIQKLQQKVDELLNENKEDNKNG